MIRNPYDKKPASVKRPRPWEQQQEASTRDAVTDPFDDGGIDWGSLDDAVLTRTTATATTSESKRNDTEGLGDVLPALKEAPGLAESLNQQPSPKKSIAMLPSQKPPPVPSRAPNLPSSVPNRHQPPPRQQQSALASLRPASWTAAPLKAAPSPSQQSSGKPNRYNDPRQVSLPVSLQFDPDSVKPVQDSDRATLVKHADLSSPLLNGWKLYSHQKKAILNGLLMRRMVLALDMGLGKTLIGCVWARAFVETFQCRVIVICPVSLKQEWKRTAEEATGMKVLDDTAGKKKKKKEEESVSDDSVADVTITSWAKVPTHIATERYVVVADEAHSIQSIQSARTKDTLQLVRASNCIGVLLLTGTPMKNGKPSNLFPLLKAVKHPFGNNQRAYETHFCAGREVSFGRGRVVWNASGSSNLRQLHELVSSHVLYLTKEDCLKDLPPQTRVFQHVPVSSRRQLQHNQALQNLGKIYANTGAPHPSLPPYTCPQEIPCP